VTMVTMVAVVEIQGVKILTPPFFFSFFSFWNPSLFCNL
jgi:hypothetical protein